MSDLRKAAQDVVTVWKMHGTAESLRGWMDILEAALAKEQPMLTDDEIYDCREQGYDNDELNSPFSFLEAARAIERRVRGERDEREERSTATG